MNFYTKTEDMLEVLVNAHINTNRVVDWNGTEIVSNLWRLRFSYSLVLDDGKIETYKVTISGSKFYDDRKWRIRINTPDVSNDSGWEKLLLFTELFKVSSNIMKGMYIGYPEMVKAD